MVKISLIDYECGNTFSLLNALNAINHNQQYQINFTQNKQELLDSDLIFLPGVGSANTCMDSLKKHNLLDTLYQINAQNKPLVGICVGMQILFDFSHEGIANQTTQGLGLIAGEVKKFSITQEQKQQGYTIPQMGWNKLHQKTNSTLFNQIEQDSYFYFANSYYCKAKNHNDVIGSTEYLNEFDVIVQKNNICGFQLHPEKSSQLGLQLLMNTLVHYTQ